MIPPIKISRLRGMSKFAPITIPRLTVCRRGKEKHCRGCDDVIEIGEQYINLIAYLPNNWRSVLAGIWCLGCVEYESLEKSDD